MLWRRTLDAVVLLRPEPTSGDPVVVTGGGPAVWDLLDEPATVDELTAALAEAYDADPTTVEADVTALLADLERRGFVEPHP